MKISTVIRGIIGALVLAVIGVCGLFWWNWTHPYIEQSKGAISREEAMKHCSVPLPASAHDVYYSNYSDGLQVGEFLVQFEAPVKDCRATADAIYAAIARKNPKYTAPKFTPVSHPPRAGSSYMPVDWFDNDHIEKGAVGGKGYEGEPTIWIDEERGIFYYKLSD